MHSGTASPVIALIKRLSLNSEHLMGILLCKYGLSIPPQYKDNGNNQQHDFMSSKAWHKMACLKKDCKETLPYSQRTIQDNFTDLIHTTGFLQSWQLLFANERKIFTNRIYFHFPISRVSQKKETNCRRFESLCLRKDLVQQDPRGQIWFLQSFVIKSPICARKLMVAFADNEDLGDKQVYMGQQYSLDGDQYRLPFHSDFKHQSKNIHHHLHPKTYYNCTRPLPRKHLLQAVKPYKARNNNNRKGILQLERRGKFTHSPLNLFASAWRKQWAGTETSNFSKTSSVKTHLDARRQTLHLGDAAFSSLRYPLRVGCLWGCQDPNTGKLTWKHITLFAWRRAQCCPSRLHPRSLNTRLLP